MKALHGTLFVISCAAAVMAQQDPNYLAHGLYHPDIQAVVPVVGANPGGVSWANSYSVGNKCYCIPNKNFGPGVEDYPVETPRGWMTVKEICQMIGTDTRGASGRPIYNDVQCGNGPPSADKMANEHHCPGKKHVAARIDEMARLIRRSISQHGLSCFINLFQVG